jgi:hypothetical protein
MKIIFPEVYFKPVIQPGESIGIGISSPVWSVPFFVLDILHTKEDLITNTYDRFVGRNNKDYILHRPEIKYQDRIHAVITMIEVKWNYHKPVLVNPGRSGGKLAYKFKLILREQEFLFGLFGLS